MQTQPDFPGQRAAPSFDDPIEMLRACHARLEHQLATLERLQKHLPENGADAQARTAARAVLRYFDQAEPNHVADEEASLFPRLLARAFAARDLVVRLEQEHARLEGIWRRLRPLLAGIASGQRAYLPPSLVHEVRRSYEAHLACEEDALLPLCERHLTDEDLSAIGAEMAARRGNRLSGQDRP